MALEGIRAVHCIGVGGSGMSPIAEVLLARGCRVSGSDAVRSAATDRLAGLGLVFEEGHAAAHVGDVDAVVMSSAIPPANPELVEARRRGIPVWRRGDMLAALLNDRFGIAVAGAHGKTTTTSMVALMLERADKDPTAVIGGRLAAFGGNSRVGKSALFVAEADESDRSFLALEPAIAIVTNIDREHLDSYADFEGLTDAFVSFLNGMREDGTAVLCLDDEHVRALRPRVRRRTVGYGIDAPDAEVSVSGLALEAGRSRSVVTRRHGGRVAELGELTLSVPGRHNVLNALAAASVGLELGLPFDAIQPGLEAFRGADRRFQLKGEAAGIRVVDDYGHHPTEIAAVLAAARIGLAGRLIVVFQPHRYSRTAQLRDDFGPALAAADRVLMTDIYPAGERPMEGVTAQWLAEAVERAAPGRVEVVPSLADVPARVAAEAHAGDLVITLGAGSIGSVGPRILEELARCR